MHLRPSRHARGSWAGGPGIASLVATLWLLGLRPGVAGDYFSPIRVGTISDGRVVEVSGMVPVTGAGGHYWIHNDSGDVPRVFAVRLDGVVIAEVGVPGASALDWEDIAKGPGPSGGGAGDGDLYLYVADTGNNDRSRTLLSIYRFREPRLESLEAGQLLSSEVAERFEFHYPDGVFDAEALVIDPLGPTAYIIAKATPSAGVYRLPTLAPAAGDQALVRIATLSAGDLITAADLSPEGARLLLRTYSKVLELDLPPGRGFEEIFLQPARLLPSTATETKSESICFDHQGRDIVTTSEVIPTPIDIARLKVPVEWCPYELEEGSSLRFVRGDVLLEGPPGASGVNAADAASILDILRELGGGPGGAAGVADAAAEAGLQCLDAADVTDDGSVGEDDALALLDALVTGKPPPVPFLEPGLDPTSDALGCRELQVRRWLEEDASWRYWFDLTRPPDGWDEPGAEVSSWPEGPGGVGFGSTLLGTLLAGTPGLSVSLFGRAELVIDDPAELASLDHLVLEIDYNDGFVATINGVEAARRGLGEAGFEAPPEILGKSHAGGRMEDIPVCPELLRPGVNVLAIEVRNRSRLDRTLFFRAALRGFAAGAAPAPPPPPPSGAEDTAALFLSVESPPNVGSEGVIDVVAGLEGAGGAPADLGAILRGVSFTLVSVDGALAFTEVFAAPGLGGHGVQSSTLVGGGARLSFALAMPPTATPPPAPGVAGGPLLVAQVRYRVVLKTPGSARVAFADRAGALALHNVLVLDGPRTAPALTQDLETEVTATNGPRIDSLVGNSGRAGDTFLVTGSRLDAEDLVVEVCGQEAAAVVLGGGGTLRVTAPPCALAGPAALEVCTRFGCDGRAEGFLYEVASRFWIRGDANGDAKVDISDPVAILADLFLGVTSKPVCAPAIDANADGKADLSDAIAILGFLFGGAATLPPPFPEPAPCP